MRAMQGVGIPLPIADAEAEWPIGVRVERVAVPAIGEDPARVGGDATVARQLLPSFEAVGAVEDRVAAVAERSDEQWLPLLGVGVAEPLDVLPVDTLPRLISRFDDQLVRGEPDDFLVSDESLPIRVVADARRTSERAPDARSRTDLRAPPRPSCRHGQ